MNGAFPPSSIETFFTVDAALRNQDLADLGRAGEGDRADKRVRGQLPTDGFRVARDDVQDAVRETCLLRERRQRQGRKRRIGRGLHNHGAANRKRRRNLARNHGEGEIPGRDRANHADGLPMDDDAPALFECGMVSP